MKAFVSIPPVVIKSCQQRIGWSWITSQNGVVYFQAVD